MAQDKDQFDDQFDAAVIGGGPAGLMAAEEMAREGLRIVVCEAKPSIGRKFLMAGKSGLNLTKDEPFETLLAAYPEAEMLRDILEAFDASAVQNWAQDLGQALFTGSTGRVFPREMKASPLLRAWLTRLDKLGVERRVRWRWTGWEGDALTFQTPDGPSILRTEVTVLAMGGASWARLGADGLWAGALCDAGVEVTTFAPSNAGLSVPWSAHMERQFGQPLKGVAFHAGGAVSRGEAVIARTGLEGGGLYMLTPQIRAGDILRVDLMPDVGQADVMRRLSRPRGKKSLANHLRQTLNLGSVRTALLQEFGRPLPAEPDKLASLIKGLEIRHAGLRPMDEAISVAGGVSFAAVDHDLMLRARRGVFCAGEMLDWEAPTGGYLLTACLATGRHAGRAAVRYAAQPGEGG